MISGKKLFSLGEIYIICYKAMLTARYSSKAKRNGDLDSKFIERIMLAVTQVNGCALCSYAHSKMALEAGMSNEEIQEMLAGANDGVPDNEIQAIMFAQHYADSRGKPSKEAWDRIQEIYGHEKSLGILGAIRQIMMGNAIGVPWSSLIGRFKGKRDKRSNLLYEIVTILLCPILLVSAFLHAIVAIIFRIKCIKFE